MLDNILREFAVLFFTVRILLHIGIIVSIWRFREDGLRWRPGVGVLAMLIAGVNAAVIFASFRDLQAKGFDMFNPLITALVAFLYLAILQLKGNVAMLARPIITAHCKVKDSIKQARGYGKH